MKIDPMVWFGFFKKKVGEVRLYLKKNSKLLIGLDFLLKKFLSKSK